MYKFRYLDHHYQLINMNKMANQPKFDAVIFDLDGVITKTALVHALAWKKMFDQYMKPAKSDLERFSGSLLMLVIIFHMWMENPGTRVWPLSWNPEASIFHLENRRMILNRNRYADWETGRILCSTMFLIRRG